LGGRRPRLQTFDVLVIGGGATGVGCALDAQTRGLKTLLIEREDFAAGTSSRSTKLVHGGVRYLEKAFKNLDYGQLKLVFEALHERKAVLGLCAALGDATADHDAVLRVVGGAVLLGRAQVVRPRGREQEPVVEPLFGREEVESFVSHLSGTNESGKQLKGSIVYYDGQFNDSRLAVAVACTAKQQGAVVLNHTEVVELLHDKDGKVAGRRSATT
jgi:glycerol-3-phosphate dehydrogenase